MVFLTFLGLAFVMFKSLLILEPTVVLTSVESFAAFDEGTDCLVRSIIDLDWMRLNEMLGYENLRVCFIVSACVGVSELY